MASVSADNNGSGTTSLATAYKVSPGGAAYTPVLDDLILLIVCVTKSSTGAATVANPNSSNWTAPPPVNSAPLSRDNGVNVTLQVFARWADGTANDNAPTITVTATTPTSTWRAVCVSGLKAGTALALDHSAGSSAVAAGGSLITDSPGMTSSVNGEYAICLAATRQPTGAVGSMSGGVTLQGSVINSTNNYQAMGVGTITSSGTTITPAYSWTGGGSGSAEVILTLGFSGPTASGTITLSGSATSSAAASGSITLAGLVNTIVALGSITLSGGAASSTPPASGSLTLSGSAPASTGALGSITLGGAASGSASASGSLALAGSASTKAPPASGSVTLGGAGGASTSPASGSLTLSASSTSSTAGSGQISLTGSSHAVESASGSITLTGVAAPNPPTAAGSITLAGLVDNTNSFGSLTLGGASSAKAAASALGSLLLDGLAAPKLTSSGQITLGGLASTSMSALGALVLAGLATARGPSAGGSITLTGAALPSSPPALGHITLSGLALVRDLALGHIELGGIVVKDARYLSLALDVRPEREFALSVAPERTMRLEIQI